MNEKFIIYVVIVICSCLCSANDNVIHMSSLIDAEPVKKDAIKDPQPINFFVVGDWGGLPIPPYKTDIENHVALAMTRLAKIYKPEALLALGDNFYLDGVADVNDQRFFETFENVFNKTELPFPWYLVAGNHDWHGNVSAQMEYSKKSSRWNYPSLYYSINYTLPSSTERLGIILLDTVQLCGNSGHDLEHGQPSGPESTKDSEEQWKWLESQLILMQSYAYILVGGHYPIWSVAEHGPTDSLVKRLDPLLAKYNVTAYMSGHDHNLQHLEVVRKPVLKVSPLNYFVIGASAFVEDSTKHWKNVPANSQRFYWADQFGFGGMAVIAASNQNLTLRMIDGTGKVLYTHIMGPRVSK